MSFEHARGSRTVPHEDVLKGGEEGVLRVPPKVSRDPLGLLHSVPLTWHLTEGPLKRKWIFRGASHRCLLFGGRVRILSVAKGPLATHEDGLG